MGNCKYIVDCENKCLTHCLEKTLMEKNKELTPMMELIEYIELNQPKNKTTDGIWAKAKELLPKEKQVIEEAFNDGIDDYREAVIKVSDEISDGETYYNTKYNN